MLAAGALATGSAATVAWGQTPDQTIDAGKNAQQAADALNSGCVDMEKCSWEADTPLQYLYNSPRIIGDVLYNCSTGADENAETAVGVSDSRSETTSISESISVEMSLGFLDLEESSLEFKAFSRPVAALHPRSEGHERRGGSARLQGLDGGVRALGRRHRQHLHHAGHPPHSGERHRPDVSRLPLLGAAAGISRSSDWGFCRR